MDEDVSLDTTPYNSVISLSLLPSRTRTVQMMDVTPTSTLH